MDLILEEKDATEWTYRGEGAANLVFAYTGSSPSFVGKVLRIQKAAKTKHGTFCILGPSSFSPQEKLLWKDYKELAASPTREVAARLYLEQVMGPLLGSKHVDAGVPVHVTKEFMEVVEKSASSLRPASRISAAGIVRHDRYALLISDHSCFPSYALKDDPCISVEIKPKCGFLPSSRYIAKQNDIKRTVTRFRMHQMLKFHDEEISKLSDYDPLDLFSGSKERMHKAVESLYNTPQNNFRIFINGVLVLGGLGGVGDTTDEAIRATVENALKVIIQANYGLRTKSFLELLVETIHESGVLDRLLDVQKLDEYDVEGAIHAYYNIMSQPCTVCRRMKDNNLLRKFASLHSLSLDESLKIVKRFLMAATVKDCSLIMCFRRHDAADSGGSSYDRVHLQPTDQDFDYKVFFIDLDLKPLEKMEHYYELDQKIVSCYSHLVEKTTCSCCLL